MLKHLGHFGHVGVVALALVASAGIADAGNGADLLKSVPDTTQIVMVFDVAEARDSALVASNFKKLLDSTPDAAAKLATFGIDPLKDIDTLMFAGGGVTELSQMKDVAQMVFIVEGRLPRKAVDQAALSRTKYKGVEVLGRDDTEAAFIGQRLYFTKKGMMNKAIDVALGKGKIKTAAQSPKAKLASDLAAIVRLNAPSDAEAAKAVSMFQTFMPTLKSSMGGIGLQQSATTITLTQDKAAIQVAGTLSAGELSSLIAMAQGTPAAPPPKPMPVTPKTGGIGGGAKPAPATRP